jgi:hypothetical protein
MGQHNVQASSQKWPTLAQLPAPAKALVSVVILTMAIAIVGALGQIIVHDIIPTFFSGQQSDHRDYSETSEEYESKESDSAASDRGDLFSDESVQAETPEKQPLYQTEQFVWTLKWTHIHLFGMNMIFIFMGVMVLIDIAAMWLKGYFSPAFFWLHIPGGGLFAIAFIIVSARAFWEMYSVRKNYA